MTTIKKVTKYIHNEPALPEMEPIKLPKKQPEKEKVEVKSGVRI